MAARESPGRRRLHSPATATPEHLHSLPAEDRKYLKLLDRNEGINVRTLEHTPTACRTPERVTTGYRQPSMAVQAIAVQNDPGRELYVERSRFLAGLSMPPAVSWEDLPEQDRNRWRGYAAARG